MAKAFLLLGSLLLAQSLYAQEAPATGTSAAGDSAPAATVPIGSALQKSPAKSIVLPTGTKVMLTLKSGINTKTAQAGDPVYLISSFPVVFENKVVIPPGVYVQGVLDRVQRAGRIKGRAQVSMHFTSMIFPNGSIVQVPGGVDAMPGSSGPKVTDPEGTIEQPGSKGKDVQTAAQVALAGASIGSIAGSASGSPGKGALIGGLGGAAIGGLVTLFTRGSDLDIAQGTNVEMVLQRPLQLEESNIQHGEGFGSVQSGFSPVPGQNQPMDKPKVRNRILCPLGGLGCN